MTNNQPPSRATWGRRQERTIQELEKLCGDAFRELEIPKRWKFIEYDRCRLNDDPNSEIQSIGAWFLDVKTRGQDTKRYRLWFHSYSERLGLLERSVVSISRFKEISLVNNLTPEKMKNYIHEMYDAEEGCNKSD